MPLQFVSRRAVEASFKKDIWRGFYHQYPGTGGFVEFSLPGYSADGEAALVYFAHESGGKAGQGYLLFLRRINRRWQIKKQVGGWAA